MGFFSELFKKDDYASAAKQMVEASPRLAKNVLDDFLWRYPKTAKIDYDSSVASLAAGSLVLARECYGFKYPNLWTKLRLVENMILDGQIDIPATLAKDIFMSSYESLSNMYNQQLSEKLRRSRDWMKSEKYPAFRMCDAEDVIKGIYSTWALNVISGTGLGPMAYDDTIPLVKKHFNDKCPMMVRLTCFIDNVGSIPYWPIIEKHLKYGAYRGSILEMF